ncbi:TPA: hypothetical protein ACMDRZ_003030 [Vibrio cholerae]|uniref:hypothetical protein n=1 Tax=Vibrio cholerae TaxID=666 RepID=UPI0015827BDD|nr:hypothetical protein [Vibrio cholerae]QKU65630.1 hypothetical protein HPY17_20140 [Vibrio cholerae]QKU69434.1 hypothetical protein HPY10_19790 [Vibrio cholerae]
MSKIQRIQDCAKVIFQQAKEFEDVVITFFDDGGALIEIDGVDVYLKESGDIERTDIQL